MTIEELKILAKQGEGYTLEFKENLGKKFAVEVVAFANSMGGKILIGVDDDGNIIGTDTSNNQRANIQNQISQIEPSATSPKWKTVSKSVTVLFQFSIKTLFISSTSLKGLLQYLIIFL